MNVYHPIDRKSKVIIDTCILMVGIEKRAVHPQYSLESMMRNWMDAVLSFFSDIILLRTVYEELDADTRTVVDAHIGKNITIVDDSILLRTEPEYSRIFEEIHTHPLMYAPYFKSKNQGEIHSLAYACFMGITYFSTRDTDACDVCHEIDELAQIEIVGFETMLAIAYELSESPDQRKALKSMYKEYCGPRIRQKAIPGTLLEFLQKG